MKVEEIGQKTLQNLEKAREFNIWMVEQIEAHLTNPILEVGAGIGNITKVILDKNYQVTATDIESEYLDILRNRYIDKHNLISVEHLDLEEDEILSPKKYNTILLMNVLEHINNPTHALKRVISKLNAGGKIIVLVPAIPWLYCGLDSSLGHVKRYNRKLLTNELASIGLEIESLKYFNFMGIFGWFTWGKLLNGKHLELPLIKTYETMMPLNRFFDKITRNQIGLSLIAVAIKK